MESMRLCESKNNNFLLGKKKQKCTIKFIGPEKQFYIGPQLEWILRFRLFKAILDNGDEGYGVLHLGMKSAEDLIHDLNAPPILLKAKMKTSGDLKDECAK
ncbi:hypothetical protein NPIL_125751 [Nephila pilipes]|uniref:Uncharacterized protein n=1 Tax=Nephila pilipes TaxID=299642 RepID=A0A8X6NEQ6_NEPPI|nr:hypothetical protein NPIL_125751 [Nephila pilipes]